MAMHRQRGSGPLLGFSFWQGTIQAANSTHNALHSPLARLPADLLSRIVQHAGVSSATACRATRGALLSALCRPEGVAYLLIDLHGVHAPESLYISRQAHLWLATMSFWKDLSMMRSTRSISPIQSTFNLAAARLRVLRLMVDQLGGRAPAEAMRAELSRTLPLVIEAEEVDTVRYLLQEVGVQPSTRALNAAAASGNAAFLRLLLAAGADVSGPAGEAALTIAALANAEESVEVLLQAGALPYTALLVSCRNGDTPVVRTLLAAVLRPGNPDWQVKCVVLAALASALSSNKLQLVAFLRQESRLRVPEVDHCFVVEACSLLGVLISDRAGDARELLAYFRAAHVQQGRWWVRTAKQVAWGALMLAWLPVAVITPDGWDVVPVLLRECHPGVLAGAAVGLGVTGWAAPELTAVGVACHFGLAATVRVATLAAVSFARMVVGHDYAAVQEIIRAP